MEESKSEMEKLKRQLLASRAETAGAEERLLRALTCAPSSASPPSAEGGPGVRPGHISDMITQELQAQATQVALLRSQLQASEGAVAERRFEMQAARDELEAARSVQEQLLIAADEERISREKTAAELNAALAHTARMQALGDAALEETGTVSEQVFALQEVLLDKDILIGASPLRATHMHVYAARCVTTASPHESERVSTVVGGPGRWKGLTRGRTHWHACTTSGMASGVLEQELREQERMASGILEQERRSGVLEQERLSGVLEQERLQLLRELEDMHRDHGRAGDNDDHVGQSKHLMDLAAMELSKLKVSSSSSSSSSLSPPAGSPDGLSSLAWGFGRMALGLWTHGALLR